MIPPPTAVSHRKRIGSWALSYITGVVLVGVALLIPVILFQKDSNLEGEEDDLTVEQRQYKNLVYYLFLWLFISWLALVFSDIFALFLPYLFRFIARYVNPAHRKYWRMFRNLRLPIAMVGGTVVCFVSFAVLINENDLLAVNSGKEEDDEEEGWDDVIVTILGQVMFWVAFYLVERIGIIYICTHYHYRCDRHKIEHSKDMHNALITLYEASLYLHRENSGPFDTEDRIIRNAKGDEVASGRVRASTYLARLGIDTYKMTTIFGNFMGEDPNSHWMRPAASYAIIERVLVNPTAAAALAKRIWASFVVSGSECLTAEDIAEVLGPYRREEATQIFKVLDENECGNIRLEEFVMTLVEAGKIRHDIYQNMDNFNHLINTFDWVCLFILAVVMIFFILVLYVPTIKAIQQTLSFVAIGLSFAVGRTFNHLLVGVVFVFFDHPFDVGDRVEVWNQASSIPTALIVKRQSLLYTIFQRADNGTDVQISNERLAQKRIENITRSGINRQALSIFIDFKTQFEDIVYLRQELEEFLSAPENSRDYMPGLGLNIVSLHELNKLEVRISIAHKSNWSNDKLRAARSNKFYCALLAILRKIPINKPGGTTSIGEEGRPMFTVNIDDESAQKKMKTAAATKLAARYDNPEPAEADKEDVDPEERKKAAEAKAKADAAKEAERVARTKLARMPPPMKPARSDGVSTALEVDHVVSMSTTGMRTKSNSTVETTLA
ncbi:Mechanosensitive ion channel-domain-containing protein [Mariannaea sp. PMI_226]|nr:Mechanosensitive ion channel-domain-containing protein [Mariannaea sp. PMI_226]